MSLKPNSLAPLELYKIIHLKLLSVLITSIYINFVVCNKLFLYFYTKPKFATKGVPFVYICIQRLSKNIVLVDYPRSVVAIAEPLCPNGQRFVSQCVLSYSATMVRLRILFLIRSRRDTQ
jgi:hypothetical protein